MEVGRVPVDMVFLEKLVFKKMWWGAKDRVHRIIIRAVSSEWIRQK
jgi:hypothetical protein